MGAGVREVSRRGWAAAGVSEIAYGGPPDATITRRGLLAAGGGRGRGTRAGRGRPAHPGVDRGRPAGRCPAPLDVRSAGRRPVRAGRRQPTGNRAPRRRERPRQCGGDRRPGGSRGRVRAPLPRVRRTPPRPGRDDDQALRSRGTQPPRRSGRHRPPRSGLRRNHQPHPPDGALGSHRSGGAHVRAKGRSYGPGPHGSRTLTAGAIEPAGSRQPHTSIEASPCLKLCVPLQGILPSRN